MNWEKFIWRKKLNGKRALGLPLAGLFLVPIIVLSGVMWRTSDAVSSLAGNNKKNASNIRVDVNDITSASSSFRKVKDDEREKSAVETSSRATDVGAESVHQTSRQQPKDVNAVVGLLDQDPLTAAVTEPLPTPKTKTTASNTRRDLLDEDGIAVDAHTAADGRGPAVFDEVVAGTPPDSKNPKELGGGVYRRDFSVAPSKVQGVSVGRVERTELISVVPTIASIRQGVIPRGHPPVLAIVTETVSTLADNQLVTFALIEPLIFNGRTVLPVGTRLLGTASGGHVRDRMNVSVSAIQWPDASETAVSAIARDADGQVGVRGYYIAEDISAQISTYGVAYAQSWLAKFATPQPSLASVVGTAQTPDPFRQQLAEFLIAQTRQQAEVLKERYKPYVVVPKNTEMRLQFLVTTKLGVQEMPLLPKSDTLPVAATSAASIVSQPRQ